MVELSDMVAHILALALAWVNYGQQTCPVCQTRQLLLLSPDFLVIHFAREIYTIGAC
jgi:hypothetical protein